MTQAQSGIIKENTKLLQLLLDIHDSKCCKDFFDDDINQAISLAIASMYALHNSLKRDEQKIFLTTNQN